MTTYARAIQGYTSVTGLLAEYDSLAEAHHPEKEPREAPSGILTGISYTSGSGTVYCYPAQMQPLVTDCAGRLLLCLQIAVNDLCGHAPSKRHCDTCKMCQPHRDMLVTTAQYDLAHYINSDVAKLYASRQIDCQGDLPLAEVSLDQVEVDADELTIHATMNVVERILSVGEFDRASEEIAAAILEDSDVREAFSFLEKWMSRYIKQEQV